MCYMGKLRASAMEPDSHVQFLLNVNLDISILLYHWNVL
uniref:Uncharacterized protein n=1 Tax=Anguilla anguilla TaxID=7936 RepID=A0A0E9RXY4_ANGAN